MLFPVDKEGLLIINVLPGSGDHVDIDLNPRLVIILHSPLLIGNSVEALLEGEQLVLEHLVLSLSLPELHGLASELSNEAVFGIHGCGRMAGKGLMAKLWLHLYVSIGLLVFLKIFCKKEFKLNME